MRVSVLMPTHNRADYIAQSLESIFRQTRAADEVIVVDDGSTDATPEIVSSFAGVRYIRQENLGVAAARNCALAAAEGDIIAWLDSDDLWRLTFLETTTSLLEQWPFIDGVYTGHRHIDHEGQPLDDRSRWVSFPETLFDELWRANRIVTPSVVVRRSCYEKVGPFDEELAICEDADMWLRLAARFKIVGLPRELVNVRIHDQNTMDPAGAFARNRLLLVEKWRERLEPDALKRAQGYALRDVAIRYIANSNSDQGWDYLEQAICTYPEVLHDLETLYELAIGARPRGQRSRPSPVDGAPTVAALSALIARCQIARAHKCAALSNLFLALAMLNDQAGDWRQARHYIRSAIRWNPGLLRSRLVLRRLAKLHASLHLFLLARRYG